MILALGAMLTMTFQYNQHAQELLALSSTDLSLLLPIVEKPESNDLSDWPGQPARTLNSKELKLVRIGQGGPSAGALG
jgi:hypothetical protein